MHIECEHAEVEWVMNFNLVAVALSAYLCWELCLFLESERVLKVFLVD